MAGRDVDDLRMGVQNTVFDDAEGGLFHRRWLGQGTDIVISFAGMATALGGDLRLEGLQPTKTPMNLNLVN